MYIYKLKHLIAYKIVIQMRTNIVHQIFILFIKNTRVKFIRISNYSTKLIHFYLHFTDTFLNFMQVKWRVRSKTKIVKSILLRKELRRNTCHTRDIFINNTNTVLYENQ